MPEIATFADPVFTCFSKPLRSAIADASMPGLSEGPVDQRLTALLRGSEMREHLGAAAGKCFDECISGLWLIAGDLDRSHTISQDLPSAEGSFLHGIMHRREGDFSNAKYWFRRVGSHPVFEQISNHAGTVYDDPFEFVDECREALRGGDATECEAAQWVEWQCLMSYIIDG